MIGVVLLLIAAACSPDNADQAVASVSITSVKDVGGTPMDGKL